MSSEDIDRYKTPKVQDKDQIGQPLCMIRPYQSLRPRMICPRCQAAKLDYDGLLNLVCPNCGLTETGAST